MTHQEAVYKPTGRKKGRHEKWGGAKREPDQIDAGLEVVGGGHSSHSLCFGDWCYGIDAPGGFSGSYSHMGSSITHPEKLTLLPSSITRDRSTTYSLQR